ncbi:MAG: hypothetical protein JW730_18570 [Anaerolineales bacterium]|nr:hypothetical protein [Anaerolineales bacterium]
MTLTIKRLSAVTGCMVSLFIFYACVPSQTQESAPIKTYTLTFVQPVTSSFTLASLETEIPTWLVSGTENSCQLSIHGTYNFPGKIDKVFSMGSGRHLFYDAPGGGHYGNDQAGCELNQDCTQLRATNKDSADPNPEGVVGPWVDSQTEVSTAQWNQYAVQCRLADSE